jgi:hypothetical protein
MVFFSLLFAAVFLVFWFSFPQNRLPCLVSVAVSCLTGTVLALVRYLFIAEPRVHNYGLSLYGTALLAHILPPVALSSAAFFLLRWARILPPEKDGADKTGGWASRLLFALVPYSAVFTLSSPEPGTVKALVLLPVLWVAVITVTRFFALRAVAAGIALRILLVPAILAVPCLGAAVYCAWFAKETLLLAAFLLPLAALAVLHFLLDYKGGT